jgi:hypothetical protein
MLLAGSLVIEAGAFDLFQKAKDAATGSESTTKSTESKDSGAGSAIAATSTEPVTYKNQERKFAFTIPAGWELSSGSPTSETVSFRKTGTSQFFTFNISSLGGSFPAEKSVQASLKSAKDDIKQGKNISAKRRDDFCGLKDKKTTCARGWELTDSGKNGPQRIIWQCYDRKNNYYNFMASSEQAEFKAAETGLQTIVNSIQFEK